MSEQSFLDTFQLRIPLIQAGMGGVSGIELASRVSNMGCLGVLAQYKNSPADILISTRQMRERTPHFFGVNFIPEVSGQGLLEKQIDAVIRCEDDKLAVVFYGLPPIEVAKEIANHSIPLIIQVGTKEMAERAYSLGANCIVLQGIQAGGHLLGTLRTESLLLEMLECGWAIPLIVSGGISLGTDYLYYRGLGASGCMCGTLFTAAAESNAHPKFKELIVASNADDTVITDLFHIGWPGRVHRVIENDTVRVGQEQPITFIAASEVLGKKYPVPRFSAATPLQQTSGSVESMALYCGESCENINSINTTKEIIEKFYSEMIS
jgi:nitronate monooxygenase